MGPEATATVKQNKTAITNENNNYTILHIF
jgi:hypothetical protein